MVESPGEKVIFSALINGIKTDEPLMAELAQKSTMGTLRQFMGRVEAYVR